MDMNAKDLAGSVSDLVTFPEVAMKINQAVADDEMTLESIGAIVETDPALSAALLRIANSPIYSVGGTVENVEKAAVVVGLRGLRDLAFAICSTHAFDGIPNELITVEDFWKHSIYCACASEVIAQHKRVCRGESLFTMGMLHDIGKLVMFSQHPELSRQALIHSLDHNDGLAMYQSEREIFGFDHTDVGAELARYWDFPEGLISAIGHHHQPFKGNEGSDAYSASAIVVHVANSIAVMAELDSHNLEDAPPIDPRAIEFLSIDQHDIEEILSAVNDQAETLLSVFTQH